MENFLAELRKNPTYSPTRLTYIEPFFCIDFNKNGAFVKTVDQKLQEIEVDYMNYNGEVFTVLRTLDHIRTRQQFVIRWEGAEDYIYLHEYDYLIYLLIRCRNLVDSKGNKLTLETDAAGLVLKITETGRRCKARFYLDNKQEQLPAFRLLTDSFALAGNRIYPIESIGESYRQLHVFATEFQPENLETYLTVLYSHLRGIRLDYKDYKVRFSSVPVSTLPVLIFEKIASDKSLFLRLSKKLPNIEHETVEHFELTVDAQVNDMEKTVMLKTIVQEPFEPYIEKLHHLLAKYAPDKEIRKEIYQDYRLFIVPEKVAGSFIINELPELLNTYTVYGTQTLSEYRIRPLAPKLELKMVSRLNYLEGEASLVFGEEKLSLSEALDQFGRQNYILLADGTRAIVNRAYMQRLEQVFRSETGRRIRASVFDLPLIEDMQLANRSASFTGRQRDIYQGFNAIDDQPLELPPLQARLRDYQLKGVKWMDYLYRHGFGGCLADDMGLGKTLQTITLLAKIYRSPVQEPSLIVMPKSLLYNWLSEIKKFAPQLSVCLYYGGNPYPDPGKVQVILTTYGVLRGKIDFICSRQYHAVILDESQHIKNRNSQTAQAVFRLHGRYKLALSGTPIENNLTELYPLFQFLNPGMFGTFEDFTRWYVTPIQRNNDKNAILALKKKIYPFILRRLKKDVLSELPDRIEQTVYVEMSDEQRACYETRRQHFYTHVKHRIATEGLQSAQFILFQAVNELRRIASVPETVTDGAVSSAKIELLTEYLLDAVANDHKVIVFFNFIAGLELVGDRLNELDIDFVAMTGSTKNRQAVIDRFQKDENCKVFLMTLKTGGVGLNLTAADTVFIFEPWWNKAAEEQAVGRIYRIGQTQKVLSYSLITRGSIEEKIELLQQQKTQLFSSLIESDSTSLKCLSETDIDYILG